MTERDDSALDEILFACLERPEQEWEQAVAGACREHAALAQALRDRFELLRSFGMTEDHDQPKRIGCYQLLRPIGGGSMGTVFLARRDGAAELVAVKILQPGLRFSSPARQRFAREREIAQRLAHPGICAVRETGEADGVPFLAMEFIEGQSLAEWIARRDDGPAAERIEVGLRITAGVARALHAAHRAGLVHRDIKPGNIIVRPDGQPVLLDFGLGRDLDDGEMRLTRTGSLLGSPAYLAPEVIQGAPADPRSDIYSLGVTFFECSTGRLPFVAPTHEALFHRILKDPVPDLRRLDPELGRGLDAIVQCAMARRPPQRYVSAAAFADDLEALSAGRPVSVRSPGAGARAAAWSRRNPLITAFVVVLLAGLLSTIWLLGEVSQGVRRLRAFGLADTAANAAPDLAVILGRRAVELLDHPLTVSQLQAAVARYHRTQVFPSATAAIRQVTLRPDHAGVIAVARDGSAYIHDGDGALRARFSNISKAMPGPVEGSVVLVGDSDVLLWEAGGGSSRSLVQGRVLDAVVAGSEVLAVVASGLRLQLHRTGAAAVVDLGLDPAPATASEEPKATAVIATSGRVILVHSQGRITCLGIDGGVIGAVPADRIGAVDHAGASFVAVDEAGATWYRRAPGGGLEQVRRFSGSPEADGFWFAPGDDRLAVREGGMRIRLLDRGGAVVGLVPDRGVRIESLAFSADGGLLALGDGDAVVRLYAADGSFRTALHGQLGHATSLVFSPDGESLAVGSYDRHTRIFRVRPAVGHVLAGHGSHVVRVDAFGERVLWVEGSGELWGWTAGAVQLLARDVVHAGFLAGGAIVCGHRGGRCSVLGAGEPIEVATGLPRLSAVDLAVSASLDSFTLVQRPGTVGIFSWDGAAVRSVGVHDVGEGLLAADYHAPSRTLVAAHGNGQVIICDLANSTRDQFSAHDDWVWSVRFAPGGAAFLTTSRDNTARLWDRRGGRLAEFLGHEGTVARGVFSADGELIATASTDHTVRVWHRDGRLRQVLRGHHGQVWDVTFSRDDEYVISGAYDRSLRLWPVRTARLLELSRQLVDRALTPVERRLYAEYLGDGR